MGLVNFLIKIGLDTTDVNSGVKRVESSMSGMTASIGGHLKGMLAGFVGFAVIEETLRKSIDLAGKLTDQMKRLGMSSEFLQSWQYGFSMAGANEEQVTKFFEHLRRAKEDAMESGKAGGFEAFGISTQELKSTTIEESATKIARAFKDGASELQRAKFLELGGKGSGSLIPAFTEDIEESARAAKEMGVVMDDVTRVKLDALGDSMTTWSKKILVLAGRGVAEVAGQSGYWDTFKTVIGAGFAGISGGISEIKYQASGFKFKPFIEAIKDTDRTRVFDRVRQSSLRYSTQEFDKSRNDARIAIEKDKVAKASAEALRLEGLQRKKDASMALIHPSAFKSSSDNSVSSIGGYYLGSAASAKIDLERANNELLRKTEEHLKSISNATTSINEATKE